jgi:propionyl-CoA carboxylase alpha chain
LTYFRPPAEDVSDGKTLRIDTGVYEGAEISMFYDPMIAKVVTHAPTRIEAIDHMAASLDGLRLEGIRHNVPFLAALMRHDRFREGNLSTNFIAEEYPEGFEGGALTAADRKALLAAAVFVQVRVWERQSKISGQLREGGLAGVPADMVARVGKDTVPCRYQSDETSVTVHLDGRGNGGKQKVVSDWQPGEALFQGTVGGRTITALVEPALVGYRLTHGGATIEVSVERPRIAELAALMPEKVAPDTSKYLLCPMPGILVSVNVKEGQEVKAGEALAVVEAMKMENVLLAERDGVVESIKADAGASLAADDVILEFAGESDG